MSLVLEGREGEGGGGRGEEEDERGRDFKEQRDEEKGPEVDVEGDGGEGKSPVVVKSVTSPDEGGLDMVTDKDSLELTRSGGGGGQVVRGSDVSSADMV